MYSSTDIYINFSDLTYQYTNKGEISLQAGGPAISVRRIPTDSRPAHHTFHNPIVDSIDDIPKGVEAYFRQGYTNFPQAYERRLEIAIEHFERFNNSPSSIAEAWIFGLHPDGGEQIANHRKQWAESKVQIEQEQIEERARDNRITELELALSPTQLKTWKDNHEEGVDYWGSVNLGGQKYTVSNRCDIGFCIHNPSGTGVF